MEASIKYPFFSQYQVWLLLHCQKMRKSSPVLPEHAWESGLYRVQGELLTMIGAVEQAETSFRQAITIDSRSRIYLWWITPKRACWARLGVKPPAIRLTSSLRVSLDVQYSFPCPLFNQ